jgi:hypothetical protein
VAVKTQILQDTGRGFALVPVIRLEAMQESVRCVETDIGEVYFEFWVQGRQSSVRIHADTYLATLAELRRNPGEDKLFVPPVSALAEVRE